MLRFLLSETDNQGIFFKRKSQAFSQDYYCQSNVLSSYANYAIIFDLGSGLVPLDD